MNAFRKKWPIFLILLLGCSSNHDAGSFDASTGLNSFFSTNETLLETEALKILNDKCASCHSQGNEEGGFSGVTNIQYLLSNNYLVDGEPEQSLIYLRIAANEMPANGSLSIGEKNTIWDWIKIRGRWTGGMGGQETFFTLSQEVLIPKCVLCHGAQLAEGGIRLDNYEDTLFNLTPGVPNSSRLYLSVLDDSMPEGPIKLSGSEKERIRNWVLNGAPK